MYWQLLLFILQSAFTGAVGGSSSFSASVSFPLFLLLCFFFTTDHATTNVVQTAAKVQFAQRNMMSYRNFQLDYKQVQLREQMVLRRCQQLIQQWRNKLPTPYRMPNNKVMLSKMPFE